MNIAKINENVLVEQYSATDKSSVPGHCGVSLRTFEKWYHGGILTGQKKAGKLKLNEVDRDRHLLAQKRKTKNYETN